MRTGHHRSRGSTPYIAGAAIIACIVGAAAYWLSDAQDAPSAASPGSAIARREPGAAGAEVAALTPTQVVEAIHRARTSGRIAELDGYLVPAERGFQAPVIRAVDQLLVANAALQAAAARFGKEQAATLNLSVIGDSYHVFSLHVRAIRESIDGDDATVVIQEADRVPLVDVRLRRVDGRWLVAPERPEAGLAERLEKLARALDGIRDDLSGPISSFSLLQTAFRDRIMPLLREIEKGSK